MNDPAHNPHDLDWLVAQLLDGILTPADANRLDDMLANDPAARRRYVRLVWLDSSLQWRTGHVEPALDADDRDSGSSDDENLSETMVMPAVLEPEDSTDRDLISPGPMLPAPAGAPGGRVVAIRWATAAAILIALSAIWWSTRRGNEVVATVTAADHAVWEDKGGPSHDIVAGQQLKLRSGHVELSFGGDASVVIEAPAQFTADGPRSLTLRYGKLAAVVHDGAKGFTVTTRDVTVKDLGTEFGVMCGDSDPTEVAVFRGRVEASATQAGSGNKQVTLVAGDAAVITRGNLSAMAGGAAPEKFPHHLKGINLPEDFADDDVGGSSPAGSAQYSAADGLWIVSGAGHDIFERRDHFNFPYRTLNGDAMLIAKVVAPTLNADGTRNMCSKCGIMLREGMEPGSRFVDIVYTTSLGIQMIVRDNADDPAEIIGPYNVDLPVPVWMKLKRSGDYFTGSYSIDGTNWIKIGTKIVQQSPRSMMAGLVVSSRSDSELGTAHFSDVSIGPLDKHSAASY